MIINMQAFNSKSKSNSRIYAELDEFNSRKPIDIIKENNPILILDEPQKLEGKKTQEGLKEFNALFSLNYSATHKKQHSLVYQLDALDAFNKKLVKKIEVKGFDLKNLRGTDKYIYLQEIILSPNKPPMARIEMEINYKKSINRETRILEFKDNLYERSNNMEQYKGYVINEIDPISGSVSFTNGEVIHVGEVIGDLSEKDLRRIQIKETISSHFEKEEQLFSKGIKVLSLFFIDKVANYRQYDENNVEINSLYGKIFEEEYNNKLNEYLNSDKSTPYIEYLRKINVKDTHCGYFSIDKEGHKIDGISKNVSNDVEAYDLIFKEKEKLLSLENPVRFIFSHSALREGWDNPNVFQICTLKSGGSSIENSSIQKRQEVGRGLRLCVNQNGERMDGNILGEQVHDLNQLTVIASEGYEKFVSDLQKDIYQDLHGRTNEDIVEYLTGKKITMDGEDIIISKENGKEIQKYLLKNKYIDKDNNITEKYHNDSLKGELIPFSEKYHEFSKNIHKLVRSFDKTNLDNMISNGHRTKIKENYLNDNFKKEEFQTLWNYINNQYTYTVNFDSEELIKKAIKNINNNLHIPPLKYKITSGKQIDSIDIENIKDKNLFISEKTETVFLEENQFNSIKYDLIGKIAEETRLTRKTIAKILTGIQPKMFNKFKVNPEEFITKVISLINEVKSTIIVEYISYNKTDKKYGSSIFTLENNKDISKAYNSKKGIQDYIFLDGYAKDGQSIERKFVEELDNAKEVCVYAKLPRGFKIPTPVGNYSPDWAIAFNEGDVKHMFFIAETKGTMDSMNLRGVEKAKIDCAKELFASLSDKDVYYDSVDNYENLLNIIEDK